jgi:hypothetical protein
LLRLAVHAFALITDGLPFRTLLVARSAGAFRLAFPAKFSAPFRRRFAIVGFAGTRIVRRGFTVGSFRTIETFAITWIVFIHDFAAFASRAPHVGVWTADTGAFIIGILDHGIFTGRAMRSVGA